MSTKRKLLIGVLAAAMMTLGVALPGFAAPEKIFSLTAPTSLAQTSVAQTNVPVTVTIKNETPTGNSSINSMHIAIASGPAGFLITGWDPSTISGGVASLSSDGKTLFVTNMSPLKNGVSEGVKLFVTVPAATNCANSAVTWTGDAWTGSSFTGSTFRLLPSPNSQLTTALSVSCKLQFVSGRQPANAVKATTITNTALNSPAGSSVQVELLVSGVRSGFLDGQTVTLTKGGTGTGTVSGGTALLGSGGSGVADFGTLSIDLPGNYTLTASMTASGVTSSNPSAQFTIFDAGLGCGVGGSNTYSESSQQLTQQGSLQITNATGTCVGVTVENSSLFDTGANTNTEQWSVLKTGASNFKGTITYTWELPSVDPIPWTRVQWDGLANFVPLALCNPIWDGTPGGEPANWIDLFPTVGGVQQQMCLVDQTLDVVNGVHVQRELVALNKDALGRKP
jgi:hypothetical protein